MSRKGRMNIQRILIVGSDNIWSIERIYARHLKELGVAVEIFPAQNLFLASYNKSLVNKLLYKAGLSRILHGVNQSLRQHIEKKRPDAVWVFKGMEVFPSTIQWIHSLRVPVVNYNPDNPFIFTGSGSGNKNVTRSIRAFDLHFTYSLAIKSQLEKIGCKVALLPFGFDLADKDLEAAAAAPEILKLCFLGNPDKDRASFIRQLADGGIQIDLFGNNWGAFISHPNIGIFDAVYAGDFWIKLRQYRVQLNLMRVHNLDSHNMRSFEVPGIGGIMLAPDTPEHRLFFKDGEEAFLFTDATSCMEKANQLLRLDKAGADRIRENARKRSLASGYSYKDRSADVLKVLASL
ncbi:glycosyltransferase [Flavihumibacter rivuli]|uniref:CgeB family protein n=1 Tax=Flavihumibacter rivuli TaxID=2838156 RepID=UPI001BDF0829|nr:glycosyltransferase [Flavihumibacter rivuli]ULQ56263.1 glycosyltransferase [Flavihumibacter rivuli]